MREKAAKERIVGMLKTWIATGALKVIEGDDATRDTFDFVEVGERENA